MSHNKKLKKEDTEGESGQGGRGGRIEYTDFLGTGESVKQALSVHESGHEGRVKLQKELISERKTLKEGKNQGLRLTGSGTHSQFKSHPISQTAQFSGSTDKRVTGVPCDLDAQTNDTERNKLQLGQKLQHAPAFNPRPNF